MENIINIFLIEDDVDDIELLEIALKDNNILYTINILMEGSQVQDYINNSEQLPDVIVMDFNLPKVHGREILFMFKNAPKWNELPIVVLTTSAAKEDAEFALENGARHFITKPTTIQHFNDTVAIITQVALSSKTVK